MRMNKIPFQLIRIYAVSVCVYSQKREEISVSHVTCVSSSVSMNVTLSLSSVVQSLLIRCAAALYRNTNKTVLHDEWKKGKPRTIKKWRNERTVIERKANLYGWKPDILLLLLLLLLRTIISSCLILICATPSHAMLDTLNTFDAAWITIDLICGLLPASRFQNN